MNPFPYSNTNKRYHTLSYYNHMHFGGRIDKAVLDGGFSCPNLDGRCGHGGCIYCADGSGYFTQNAARPIREQLDLELDRIHRKFPNAKAIAYFQSHTNTYAPVSKLKLLFEEALQHENICGLSIATRADCLPPDVIEYLTDLHARIPLTVELGLQSVHDETAKRIHRGHTYADFQKGYHALKSRGIRVCIHLINGLPDETPEMMLQTARQVGHLRPDALKLHLLHVIENTPLHHMYVNGQYTPLTREEYIAIIVQQLELFPPKTVIERLTGDGDRRTLVAPLWSLDKIRVLGSIDLLQAKRNSWQSKFYEQITD